MCGEEKNLLALFLLQKNAAADALKVSKDKELWFIVGLGIFIVAVILSALVGIKYARSCLLGDRAASSGKVNKVAPRQNSGTLSIHMFFIRIVFCCTFLDDGSLHSRFLIFLSQLDMAQRLPILLGSSSDGTSTVDVV